MDVSLYFTLNLNEVLLQSRHSAVLIQMLSRNPVFLLNLCLKELNTLFLELAPTKVLRIQ